MSDERIFDLLAAHSGPAPLDAGFEDRLFSVLQGELRQRRSPGLAMMLAAALVAVALMGAAAIGAGFVTLPWVDRAPITVPTMPTAGPTATSAPTGTPRPEAAAHMVGMHVGHTTSSLPDGRVLIAGGWDSYGAETYDPNIGTWSTTAPMVEMRDGHTATVLLDGTVLVVGGADTDMRPAHKSAEVYEPASDTWTTRASMTNPRAHHTATLLPDGRVLVAGGSSHVTGGTPQASVELYDPARDQWTTLADMNAARSRHTATLLQTGMVLVAGGSADSKAAELYDPGLGTWTSTGAMAASRGTHAAVLLGDGRVLIVGGAVLLSQNSFTDSTYPEVYDPITDSWARTAPWSGLQEPAVAILPGGHVLVSDRGHVDLYDPATDDWTAAPALSNTWWGYSATLLSDGTVLMAGGWNAPSRGTSPVERYDPAAE